MKWQTPFDGKVIAREESCRICHAEKGRKIGTVDYWDIKTCSIVSCENCGHIQLDPMLNDEETSKGCFAYYVEEFSRTGTKEQLKNCERNFRRGVVFGYHLKNRHISPRFVLELGPGSGYFAAGLQFVFPAVEITVMDMFQGYDIFHIEGYLVQNHDLIRTAVKMAKQAGLIVSVDLASYNVVEANLEFLNEMISDYVDIVFANEEEARAFTGKEPEEALIHISDHCDIAVVKIGKEGSYIKSESTNVKVLPRLANCIDTTGAGDLYAAGFLYGLACDYNHELCGKIGSLVSGKVVEVIGAKMSDKVWGQIHDEIKRML